MQSSVPSLEEFNPHEIPYQYKVIKDIRTRYDYELGTHEVLLSGSVGSAKSLLMAHIIATHCITYPNAQVGIGRLTMPSLRETLMDMIQKHLSCKGMEGRYGFNKTSGKFRMSNGSKILPFSWKDGNYEKFRSIPFSMFAIEELTENHQPEVYDAILMRCGRFQHVKEKLLISATNPDDPSHWAHKRIIDRARKSQTIHVYYSKTKDNKFLPPSYYDNLARNLDPKMAQRMLEGLWIAIRQDVIYYQYQNGTHFKDRDYTVNPDYPVCFSWDFNIGAGKPMSCVFFQFINDTFHFFDEVVVEGARTLDVMEEAAGRGLLDYDTQYLVNGDATGSSRTTNYNKSNYDIIKSFLANYTRPGTDQPLDFRMQVPKSNPAVKTRHNLVNGYLRNAKGDVRIAVYRNCQVLDEGFRLTKLKDRGQYVEDDSKPFQHVTTAAGYGIYYQSVVGTRKEQGTVEL